MEDAVQKNDTMRNSPFKIPHTQIQGGGCSNIVVSDSSKSMMDISLSLNHFRQHAEENYASQNCKVTVSDTCSMFCHQIKPLIC